MPANQSMLVASPSRWDEACFAVPAVRALAVAGIRITVVCPVAQGALWKSLGMVDVLPAPSKRSAIAAAIVGKAEAILLWEPGDLATAAKKAGIPRRIGPALGKLAKLLTDPSSAAPGPLEHRVQFYLNVVNGMGIETARPEFFAPADLGVATVERSILLAPDSDFGASHEWPLERWQEVVKHLSAKGAAITVACLGGGRNVGHRLADSLSDAVTKESMDLANPPLELLASQSLVIAADGSLPHLASHGGATCITLFGPNDPQWKRPLGKRHTVVKHHVECAPCLMPKCPLDMRCQNELTTARVIAAVDAHL